MQRKRPTRFKPDETDSARISYNPKDPKSPIHPALILNESLKGAALVLTSDKRPRLESVVRVKVGKLDPMLARVAWIQNVDGEAIWKMGIEFLE